DSAFLTTFWATLSALFPEGESFFVESVRNYRSQITDPVLKAQIAGFIGQEAMHTKEHQALNEAIRQQGFPIDKLDRDVGKLLHFVQKVAPKPVQLAVTAALEHYTAILAEQLLTEPEHSAAVAPKFRELWQWHALEENEHKTVAFDVLKQVNDSYVLRAGTMIPVTLIFFAVVFVFHVRMLAAEKALFNFGDNVRGMNYLFGRKGLFTRLVPKFLDYFKPGFHPLDHDTRALLEEWRERLFGENGPLREQVKMAGKKSA
ncbi:MAG TPA: metal-dependent hydrolase, partial [Pseudomonadales bacterium]|nr:metal-dependent hydrolase [Pseudomonadales bacterium]